MNSSKPLLFILGTSITLMIVKEYTWWVLLVAVIFFLLGTWYPRPEVIRRINEHEGDA